MTMLKDYLIWVKKIILESKNFYKNNDIELI